MTDPQANEPASESRKRSFSPTALVLVLLAAWAAWVILSRLLAPSGGGIGERLPALAIEPLVGDAAPLGLSDLEGRVTLLNIWGPWCPPCRSELPHLAQLRQHYANNPAFQLAAVAYLPGGLSNDLQSLKLDTETLLKKMNLDMPAYCDPDSRTLKALDPVIGFQGFPTNVLLDRRGVIRAVWVGYRPGDEADLQQEIDKLLAEADGEKKL